ncbi:hypothetical protein HFO41_24745 [Rhizobium leguminosarum]|uniref:hypothetical protein n=1 Tax=Rhizobium leguminosarum TaxID=384 RepID=UPI001C96735A|nr:hypothetical protein [Rhizobium leguminosarum]MBY5691994.1 hypothetical protein [Rhizobium leguminosarum]
MTATANHGDHTGKRVRASENALRIALKAARAEGMVVDKLCVNGGQIEIHFHGVEGEAQPENDGDLEKW